MMESYYKAGSLEHSLSAALLHVGLLRERGGNTEADRIVTELLAALQQLVEGAVQRWQAQTNAQEGVSFELAMKDLEAATLTAQDAKDAPLTEEQRHIENCCEKPHDCKWGGLGGCGYAGRKYEAREGVK
jgi:hypothetical protein